MIQKRHALPAILALGLAGCGQPATVRPGSTTPTATIAPAVPQVTPQNVDPGSPGPGYVRGGYQSQSVMWVHMPSRTRSGNIVRAWITHNHLVPLRGSQARSHRVFIEFDCSGRRERTTHLIGYSGFGGSGDALLASPLANPRWEPVPPGTLADGTLDVACGR